MRLIGRIMPVLLLLTLISSPAQSTEDGIPPEASASDFVNRLDAGDMAGAWQALTPVARIVKSADRWQLLHKTLRTAYGPTEIRTLRCVTLQNRYPMLPDGRYAVIQFDTIFENKRSAIETLVLTMPEDGRWLIHDYIIN